MKIMKELTRMTTKMPPITTRRNEEQEEEEGDESAAAVPTEAATGSWQSPTNISTALLAQKPCCSPKNLILGVCIMKSSEWGMGQGWSPYTPGERPCETSIYLMRLIVAHGCVRKWECPSLITMWMGKWVLIRKQIRGVCYHRKYQTKSQH